METPYTTVTVHQIYYYELAKFLRPDEADAFEDERANNETSNGDVVELEVCRDADVDQDSMWPHAHSALLHMVNNHGWPEGIWQISYSW